MQSQESSGWFRWREVVLDRKKGKSSVSKRSFGNELYVFAIFYASMGRFFVTLMERGVSELTKRKTQTA